MDTKSSRETCVAGGNDLRCYHEMIRGDQSFAKGGCLFFFFVRYFTALRGRLILVPLPYPFMEVCGRRLTGKLLTPPKNIHVQCYPTEPRLTDASARLLKFRAPSVSEPIGRPCSM